MRLVVAQNFRRLKIGSNLLLKVEAYARSINHNMLLIFTNSLNPMHTNFVTHHGYSLVTTIPRSLMRGNLLIWRRIFNTNSDWETLKSMEYSDSASILD